MSKKISVNISDTTERQVAQLKAVFGFATDTDVYIRAVNALATLSELGDLKSGIQVKTDVGEYVRIVFL